MCLTCRSRIPRAATTATVMETMSAEGILCGRCATASIAISSQTWLAAASWNGRLRSPVSLAARMRSSTRAWRRWRSSRWRPASVAAAAGEKPGDPVPVGVGEPQLRARMGAFLAQDQPGAVRPGRQVRPTRWPRRPGALARLVVAVEGGTHARLGQVIEDAGGCRSGAGWRPTRTAHRGRPGARRSGGWRRRRRCAPGCPACRRRRAR